MIRHVHTQAEEAAAQLCWVILERMASWLSMGIRDARQGHLDKWAPSLTSLQ